MSDLVKNYNFLSIGAWNIHNLFYKINGVYFSKLQEPEFLKTIKGLDLFCLSETHISQEQNVVLEGYQPFKSSRPMSNNKRYYGGLLFICTKINS